ncbi:ABC transporter permease [Lysobacter pythonis]|uniref:ABC transporter permease n=1 Tax=Solilutibacter pythonis TaxID=2483112 RepID=A0A3M2HT98_9GAMM|nr:ABC transporter permease [Lysobacter pythonis]RMH92971.1 ABC transporter permease [Lysobacter pythonis]
MTLAVPLLFMFIYGYAYILGSPERTVSVGLLPAALAADDWRSALPADSFRISEIAPEKLEEHLRDGEPALILDRNPTTGEAIVHTASYWRPVAELMLCAIEAAPTLPADIDSRLRVVAPGNSPFFMLPAIMVMALLNVGLFTAGVKLLQERARGTLRLYRMLPVSMIWYFAAELCTKLVLAMAIVAGYMVLAMVMFGLELSWMQVACVGLISLLLSAVFISIGLCLGSVLSSYSLGIHAFTLCNLLVLFLGDLFFNASKFAATKWIALAMPTTYGMDLLRHVMFDASLQFPVTLSLGALLCWLLTMLALALGCFNYKARE